jgi:glutathione peroxidase
MIKYIGINIVTALSFIVSIYSFQLNGINGGQINMSNYHGKKILLVNTASTSPYTSQYAALEQLHQKFKDSGLVIIAIPSNSFGNEAGNDNTIKNFIIQNYNAHFLITKKCVVKGNNAIPIYKWAADAAQNGAMNDTIKKDFCKILIDSSGSIMAAFGSTVSPMSNAIQNAVRN